MPKARFFSIFTLCALVAQTWGGETPKVQKGKEPSPKAVPGANGPLVLSATGAGFATLAKFNPASDRQRWNLKGL